MSSFRLQLALSGRIIERSVFAVSLSPAGKLQVKQAAGWRCEYCGMKSWPLTVDHIIPRAVFSAVAPVINISYDVDDPRNLAAACWPCNIKKGAVIRAPDPRTRALVDLFLPRFTGAWGAHFQFISGLTRIRGRTATGRATQEWLDFNSRQSQDQRMILVAAAAKPRRLRWP